MFDGIQVWRIWRLIYEAIAGFFYNLLNLFSSMNQCIVHDYDLHIESQNSPNV